MCGQEELGEFGSKTTCIGHPVRVQKTWHVVPKQSQLGTAHDSNGETLLWSKPLVGTTTLGDITRTSASRF